MTRKTLGLLTSTLLIVSTACGGGSPGVVGGGGGSNLVIASFVADEPSPGTDTVSFAQVNASGNMVTLRVNVTDTDDVHTAAFDVVFDENLVEYVNYTTGSFLEQGGNVPLYQVGQGPGRIVVGVNRFGSSGTDAVGSQALINLNFRATDVGQSQLSVVNASLRDGSFNDISSVAWFGGSVVGN